MLSNVGMLKKQDVRSSESGLTHIYSFDPLAGFSDIDAL